MDFITKLQNDPQMNAKMNALLGRPATAPAFGFSQMQGGGLSAADGSSGGETGGALAGFDPSSQVGRHPDFSPYQGDPFTYGLTGGEHYFFGGPPGGAAAAPAPAAETPNMQVGPNGWWDAPQFTPIGLKSDGTNYNRPQDFTPPPGYEWNQRLGYWQDPISIAADKAYTRDANRD